MCFVAGVKTDREIEGVIGVKSGVGKSNYRKLYPASSMILIVFLCLFITVCWGNTLWIGAKATLAQYLIADAWQQTLETGGSVKPWGWADTWPVALLDVPALNVQRYVLAGSHGSSLAFGPGLMDGTAKPGDKGTSVISAHRDTHFAILKELTVGSDIRLQTTDGNWHDYDVVSTQVVDTRTTEWLINPDQEALYLITCYPFGSLNPNPPLRYVVIALPRKPPEPVVRLAFNA